MKHRFQNKLSQKIFLIIILITLFESSSFAKCEDLPHPPEPIFRGHYLTANHKYIFVLNDGDICFKIKDPKAKWHELKILSAMKGRVREIALDGSRLIAKIDDNSIFLMRGATLNPSLFFWTSRWGVPFGLGDGLTLPKHIRLWDLSYLSPGRDRSYIDSAGQHHMVGIGVITLFIVRQNAQTIDYFDPWLPSNLTYGVCGPLRGRLCIAGLSSSGSTLMVMDKYGNIFVRRYDFDIAGGDRVVFDYTYKVKKPHSGIKPWLLSARKLPVPDWVLLPKTPGPITNKISLEKVGKGTRVRLMRVEGMLHGQTGYYQAEYDFVARSPDLNNAIEPLEWEFFPTGLPLQGKLVENPLESEPFDLGPSQDQEFSFILKEKDNEPITLELLDYNTVCSPAQLRVSFDSKEDPINLILHSTDKIMLSKKDFGSKYLQQNATIEVPDALITNFELLGVRQKKFIKNYLKKKRFTRISLSMKKNKIRINTYPFHRLNNWKFTHKR